MVSYSRAAGLHADYNGAMSPTSSTPATARSHILLALTALAVGGFAIGTTEFGAMAVLPEMAAGTGVTIPQGGHYFSAYALGVVVGAPLLAVAFARTPRKALLIGLMLAFALGNLASAFSQSQGQLLVARFIAGLPHGAYFGVGSLMGASLVRPNQRAKAVAFMMFGLNIATLIGVPVSAFLGRQFGWQAVFAFVAVLGVLTALLLAILLPHSEPNRNAHPLNELKVLKNKAVVVALVTGAVGGCGLFSAFSYIVPTLTHESGMPNEWIPYVLGLFGVGQIVGNLTAAHFADRYLLPTIKACLVWSTLVLTAFGLGVGNLWFAMVLVFLVGTMVALATPLQIRLMDVAGDAQTLAAAGNHASFNFANAAGAWLGGLVLAWGWGYPATGWVGAACALLALAFFLSMRQQPVPHRIPE